MTYYVGSSIRFSVEIKNASGTLIDPTTLTFELNSPEAEGVVSYVHGVDAELVKDATGQYHVDEIMPLPPGKWEWEWTSTGTGAGVDKAFFTVLR